MPINPNPMDLLATMPFETQEGSIKRADTTTQLFEWWNRIRMFAAGVAGLCADEDWSTSISLSMEQGALHIPEFKLSGERKYGLQEAHEFLGKVQLITEAANDLLHHSPTLLLMGRDEDVSTFQKSSAPKDDQPMKGPKPRSPKQVVSGEPLIWFLNRYGLSEGTNVKSAGAVVFPLLVRAIDSARFVQLTSPGKILDKVEPALALLAKRDTVLFTEKEFENISSTWNAKQVEAVYECWGKELLRRLLTTDAGSGVITLANQLVPLLPDSSILALSTPPAPAQFRKSIDKLVKLHSRISEALNKLAAKHLDDESQTRKLKDLYYRELAHHGVPSEEGHKAARRAVASAVGTVVKSNFAKLNDEVTLFLSDATLLRQVHEMIVTFAEPALASTALVETDFVWKKKSTIDSIEDALERGLDRIKAIVSHPETTVRDKLRCNHTSLVVNLHRHWVSLPNSGLEQAGALGWMRSNAR